MEKRGLFGFLKNIKNDETGTAVVDQDIEPVPFDHDQEIVDFAKDKLTEILEKATFFGNVTIEKAQADKIFIHIKDTTDPGRIIGKDAATLKALQTLLRAFIYNKYSLNIKIILDCDGYRQRRMESLTEQAEQAAEKLITENRERIALHPMTAVERRQIHMIFQDKDNISTFSEGVGSSRRIVLVRK